MPCPGRLFEGVACPSALGRDLTRILNQKIYNLETNEFISNPPFSKNEFGRSNIATQFLAGTIRVV
jgi:hypothetical protein